MPIVTVKNKYQVVIPQKIRKAVRINVGDVLEASAEKGKVVFAPKLVIDREAEDEYAPRQRRIIDARLAKALEDVRKGRTYGPFETHEELIKFLHGRAHKTRREKHARKTRR